MHWSSWAGGDREGIFWHGFPEDGSDQPCEFPCDVDGASHVVCAGGRDTRQFEGLGELGDFMKINPKAIPEWEPLFRILNEQKAARILNGGYPGRLKTSLGCGGGVLGESPALVVRGKRVRLWDVVIPVASPSSCKETRRP